MISVVFVSNFMNHHQLFISDCFNADERIQYNFIACEPIHEERLKLGYEDMNQSRDYIVRAYEQNQVSAVKNLIEIADIMIYGSAPDYYLEKRMQMNKITFLYSERYFKFGRIHLLSPLVWINLYQDHFRYRHKPLYFLSSGYYAYFDYALLGFYRNKSFRWGYFPEKISYDIERLMKKKKHNPLTILWCGRFLGWKHPEKMLFLAENLKNKSIVFEMIGDGELFDEIQKKAAKKDLMKQFRFYRSLSPKEVRKHMEAANIYLFSSDRQEGWGAVLNEAMNSACAVVASSEIGSVPYMIKNEKNGMIYRYGNDLQMLDLVRQLISDSNKREQLGKAAYKTVEEEWNPEMAASNFIQVSEALLTQNNPALFQTGPCSFIEDSEKEVKF